MKKRALDHILYSSVYGVGLDRITKKKTQEGTESQEKTYECVVVKGRVFFREDIGSNV